MSDVDALLADLDHPRADDIHALCAAITQAFPDLTSEVKWNAPSYKVSITNIATLRIQPPPNLQVILHVGSKKPAGAPDLRFAIDGLWHTWADTSRGVLQVDAAVDIPLVIDAIRQWRATLASHGLA